jgi:hypothetical protein
LSFLLTNVGIEDPFLMFEGPGRRNRTPASGLYDAIPL